MERDRADRGFGALLREYRAAAGLSQESLADRARVSPGAVSALERVSQLAVQWCRQHLITRIPNEALT